MKKLIIIGASEPGREIVDILYNGCLQSDLVFYKFYDDSLTGENIIHILTDDLQGNFFICSIGNVLTREIFYARFIEHHLIPASVISSKTWIAPSAQIAPGALIYPFCSISSLVHIAENVLINFHTSVSHGVHIGANSNLCPGTRIAGNVILGKNVYVGIGSVIKEKITVCDNVLIGANSTVLKDITEPGIYAGSPCQLLRKHPTAK